MNLVSVVVLAGVAVAEPRRLYEGSFTVLEEPDHAPQLCTVVRASYPPQCEGSPVKGWDWESVSDEQSVGGSTWGFWHVVGTYERGVFRLRGKPGEARATPLRQLGHDFSPACRKPDVVDRSQGAFEWEALWAGDFGPVQVPNQVAVWASEVRRGAFVGNAIVLPGARDAAIDVIRSHYVGPLCVMERRQPTMAQLDEVLRELSDPAARAVLGPVPTGSPDYRRGVVDADVWVADPHARSYARQRWGGVVKLHGLLHAVR